MATLIFFSCQDDEESVTDLNSFIANRDWQISGLVANAENGQSMDYYGNLDECDQDDVWRFVGNGYYEKTEGALKCEENEPQVYETGSWSLTGDQLVMRQPTETRTYTVLEATTTTLRLQHIRQIDNRNLFFVYTLTR
ncbi:lipocalin-like domain-containing protein [Rufibacter roseus]|uniref:Lipocalin family protein n=1 Tax=Rufibacter roseus TaxID=1567108 RepID=A0ABW2DEX8_9BACT|nr:lipocalin family protein [Rufibacter roseus]